MRTLTFVAAAALAATTLGQSPPGALDPQMKAVLDQHAALNPKPIETLKPEEARKQPSVADAVKAMLKSQGRSTDPQAVGKVDNRKIKGPGGEIPIRIYTPKGDGPFPVVVYWHGGGFVIADLDTYDASPRAICNAANCVVVSCHYRQAPEHPFPAAADDAYAAYEWVVKNVKDIKGDARRIAVVGESAGGNLAAGVAIQARDKKGHRPVHQVLVYPMTNFEFDTPSYRTFANAKPLNQAMMQWFWGHYLKDPKNGANPRASILRTPDLRGLPPATIILAEIDPLRSEGVAYGSRLREAGVPTKIVLFDGVTHESFGMGAVVDKAKQAVATAADGLKIGFRSGGEIRQAGAKE